MLCLPCFGTDGNQIEDIGAGRQWMYMLSVFCIRSAKDSSDFQDVVIDIF